MVDWATVASFATAGGTLVLALATFSAIRSSNRSARIAEESLLTGMRPLLVPSLMDDPMHKVLWSDRHTARSVAVGPSSRRRRASSTWPSGSATSEAGSPSCTVGIRPPTRPSGSSPMPVRRRSAG